MELLEIPLLPDAQSFLQFAANTSGVRRPVLILTLGLGIPRGSPRRLILHVPEERSGRQAMRQSEAVE